MIKNKVYLVSFEYFPISQGGLARHAKAVIDRLIKNKDYKAIIAIPKNNKTKLHKDIITIPCAYFNNKYLCYLEFSLKVLFRFRHRFNIDSFVIFSLFSCFLVPILPKKFYLFIHSNAKKVYSTDYPGENLKERLIRKLIYFINYNWEYFLCIKAKLIFVVSESLKNEAHYQYKINKVKIVTINNGVDLGICSNTKKKIKQTKNLLYVGKLIPRKNLIGLLHMFRLLVNADNRFTLHIMGNGEQNYIDKIRLLLIRLDIEKKVIFHKYISDYYLNKLYEKSDLFIFTSLIEGLPLVLLEAMSKGLPIVAYNVIGVRDVVIDQINGFLIKVGDMESFTKKILFLYKDKRTYQEFSENALRKRNDFNWDNSVKILDKSLKG